nr:unnamed protein product [Callosobruchus analis]CAI5851458.1 unnamed protein product [Callosobruchus analis]
MKLSYWQGLP